mgnify:CR=1 FL=1
MKVHIELVNGLAEDEALIRCGRVDENIRRIAQFIREQDAANSRIAFYKDNEAFYFPLETVLFFETDGDDIFAHTDTDAFRIKYRLYELENLLPRCFIRASKSAILNTRQVYSIAVNLTASSLVKFRNSHKQVYVSRRYYQALRQRLNERVY